MLGEIIADLSNWMYTYLLVILLVAAGLFFTIRNRFPQLRLLREAIRVVVERPEKEGSVSSFQALMVSTASRVGTGNIIGVSVAICMGGYGAVFWMWLIALLGGATAFTESTLAQIYKRRNPETGESYGGPAYYIEAALHSRPLAVLFALSLIATYAGGFNMLCSYNLQSTFSGYSFYSPEWTPWIIGGIVALLTGYCVMGGGKRIIAFASTLVPIMGGLYVLVALVVIVMNVGLIPQVFGRIFSEAFDFQAIFAGFTGSAVMQGVKRGLFSNEAGVAAAASFAAEGATPAQQPDGCVTDGEQRRKQKIHRLGHAAANKKAGQRQREQREQQNLDRFQIHREASSSSSEPQSFPFPSVYIIALCPGSVYGLRENLCNISIARQCAPSGRSGRPSALFSHPALPSDAPARP